MEPIDLSLWHDVAPQDVRDEVETMLANAGDNKIAAFAVTMVCSNGQALYFTRYKTSEKHGASDLTLVGALEKTKQRLLRVRDRTTTEWDDGA